VILFPIEKNKHKIKYSLEKQKNVQPTDQTKQNSTQNFLLSVRKNIEIVLLLMKYSTLFKCYVNRPIWIN